MRGGGGGPGQGAEAWVVKIGNKALKRGVVKIGNKALKRLLGGFGP